MPTFRGAWHWVFGKHEPKPPNPDRTVEAGWVPQWMAPMIVDELKAQGVPAVTTDDYNLNPYMNSREPMARVFVTEDRKAEAREIMTEILGHRPRPAPHLIDPIAPPRSRCSSDGAGRPNLSRERCGGRSPLSTPFTLQSDGPGASELQRERSFRFALTAAHCMVVKLHDAVTDLAADQEGLISSRQLRSLGISKWTQQRLVADGVIQRIAPRVYAIRGAPNTHRQKLRAGLLCLGDHSWVGFEAAAALHGLDRSDRRAVEFVIDPRTTPAAAPVRRPHLQANPPDRSGHGRWLPSDIGDTDDLRSGTRRSTPTRIEAAIDSAVRLQLSSPEVLHRRLSGLRGSGRGGCRLVEDLITDAGGHIDARATIPRVGPRVGPAAASDTGGVPEGDQRHVARVDFLFDEFAVVVEVSGGMGHSSPAERAHDAQRRNELQDLGLRVFEYTWDDVTKRSTMVGRTLRARLRPLGGPSGSPEAA